MSNPLSERRMIENQAVFRRYNEQVQQNFEKIKEVAAETNQEYLIPDDDTPLHFYCECSDENCRERIQMKPSEYSRIHKNRKQFVILNGHEIDTIEQVVLKEKDFWVVKKFVKPSETARLLQPTTADNS